MNNRDYKNFTVGTTAHIYNRGNNKENIFFDDQDYKAFLLRLGLCLGFTNKELGKDSLLSMPYSRIRITETDKKDFKLHSFCLMPNHFHLLIEQIGEEKVSSLLSKLCASYSKYINKKYKRVGHLFQDCFKAVIIEDDSQLMWTSSYIHMNPIKDHLVMKPEEYKWSSYKDFAENRNLPIVSKDLLIDAFGNQKDLIKETLNFDVKETL